MTIPFFALFIRSLYPSVFSKRISQIILLSASIFALCVLLIPLQYRYLTVTLFKFTTLAVGIYILAVLVAAFRKRSEGALIFLTGYVVLLSAGIADIVNPGRTIDFLPAALVIFIITQAFFMSYRYSNAFRTLEIQSADLLREIADRERAEEQSRLHQQQLIQADKMASLGILVSGVAHEINNPNNYIMLNSELLGKAWGDIDHILQEHYESHGDFDIAGISYEDAKDQIGQLANGITAGAKRIENIIAVLRDFSRQESGEHKTEVAVNDVIQAALVIISNLISKCTNRFSVSYGENMPLVNGSFQRLEQVVLNLLTNACQALPSKDKAITLKTYHDPVKQKNIIEIADEGIGIPEKDLPHILDPFYTTKRDNGGTGLGLSISYTIIKEHGGDITVESKPGQGTTVTVSIPSLALIEKGI